MMQATKVKQKQKEAEGIAEKRSGRRSVVRPCQEAGLILPATAARLKLQVRA